MTDCKAYLRISAKDMTSIAYRNPGVHKVYWRGQQHGFVTVEKQTLTLYRNGGRFWKKLEDYEPVLHYGNNGGPAAITIRGKYGRYGTDTLLFRLREEKE